MTEHAALDYPEHGALSSAAPRLILITATVQFWSKGSLNLLGAP